MPSIAASLTIFALTVLLTVLNAPARADTSVVVSPLPLPGPYAVACSNVAQDFSRVAQSESVQAYWEGIPRDDGSLRYVTDLLADPADTLILTVNVPSDGDLYGSSAGRAVPYVVLVCYPTASDNPRPDYVLPTGRVVPHMQRGAEMPLLADATARFPLLLFSHGSQGSPLSSDYIDGIAVFASYGYVAAAPFHGDSRIANLSLGSLSDIGYVLLHLRDFLALQALRPLSLSATIDLLLAHPQWRDHIEPSQIGGFGASLGGEAMLLMRGAGLTTSFGLSWSTVIKDARLRAAVGYVPYFGQPFFPAFGRGQHGLDDVTLPYLAISGTADTTAPIVTTLEGINQLAGRRELVALAGVTHGFDVASINDIYTWTITFLDAEVREDAVARGRLLSMERVAGGGDDHVVVPYNGPTPLNYGGLWWNAPPGSEAGWGLNIAHQGDVIFATWLTYRSDGQPWWLSMTAALTAPNTYSGLLYETHGPGFDAQPFSPGDVTATAVGSGILTFGDQNNGAFEYIANGVHQTRSITRQVFGPLPTCIFGAQPDLTLATNYQDLWWAAPAGSEAGWGINLTHQGDVIFATWFTYDPPRTPLWLSATAMKRTEGVYSGTLYRATGPAFSSVPFDPTQVALTPVGMLTLTFVNGNAATFGYVVNGVSQSKPIVRQVFRAPGTACR